MVSLVVFCNQNVHKWLKIFLSAADGQDLHLTCSKLPVIVGIINKCPYKVVSWGKVKVYLFYFTCNSFPTFFLVPWYLGSSSGRLFTSLNAASSSLRIWRSSRTGCEFWDCSGELGLGPGLMLEEEPWAGLTAVPGVQELISPNCWKGK